MKLTPRIVVDSKTNHMFRFVALVFGLAGVVYLSDLDTSQFSEGALSTSRRSLSTATDRGCTSRKNKLIYVHIPKTGGSSLERSALFDGVPKTGGHHEISLMMQDGEERGVSNFATAATIRHPCERFISAFRYLQSEKCNDGNKKERAIYIGNRTLDEYVKDEDEIDWKNNPLMHLRPMYPFLLLNNHTFGVDNILCQEQWNEGIERLEKVVGTSAGLKKKHMLENAHETCDDLLPETRHALEMHYAMDYCLFDYNSSHGNEDDTCVGTGKNRHDFTKKFMQCKFLLDTHGIKW